ncbi:hypothetical protein [Nonomuraea sp. C10]|uniref:hypothetical protein n=1 Tax=Nonomuraea sp. C10 TaxID=2600577 RepID=UPI0011CE5486|nr:hypothetical protein [Nonomuraea sp. C10]TXK35924.1 hypothetical protein FR742_42960 [Nonomuraea sp. C10]
MKRLITGLAIACAATFVMAVPAQAQIAPKNPVAAVKKQLVAGKGVKFSERTTLSTSFMREIFVRRTGTIGFRKNGVAASDITGKFNIKASDLGEEAPELVKAMAKPERTIWLGKTSYLSGGIWAGVVPEGKTWFKMPNGPTGGLSGVVGQPLNVAEPVTLRTMFKNAKAVKGGYAGKVTIRDIRKVSPWFRATLQLDKPSAKLLGAQISWRLSVDAKGLPTRLVTTYPFGVLDGTPKKNETLSVDTRYSGWGTKVSIKAPTEDDATTKPKEGSEDTLEDIEILKGVNVGKIGG